MKIAKFIDKHVWKIACIISIIASIVASLLLYVDCNKNIDSQISELYAKDTLVQQDFSNVYSMSKITCYIKEKNNVIIFYGEDCCLKATYSKDGIILRKEVEDLRIGSNPLSCVFLVILTFIAVYLLTILLLAMISILFENTNKKAKKGAM